MSGPVEHRPMPSYSSASGGGAGVPVRTAAAVAAAGAAGDVSPHSPAPQQQQQQQQQQSQQQQQLQQQQPRQFKANLSSSLKAAAALDMDNTTPVTSVQVDAVVVMKIIKHCRESFPTRVTGHLLGFDVEGTLEVTSSFPLPERPSTDEGIDFTDTAEYCHEMSQMLSVLAIDNNPVGWYQSTQLSSFMTDDMIEMQYYYQKSVSNKSIVLVHDVSRSAMGNLSLRAFRLTDAFMRAHEEGKFTPESLARHKVSHGKILEELPLRVKTPQLISALVHELEDVPVPDAFEARAAATPSTALLPNFDCLDLGFDPYLEKSLELLMESVDDYSAEQGRIQYLQRQAGRDRARLQFDLDRRREENLVRKAAGQEPLPEDDIIATRKITQEPSRLDSIRIASQIDRYCKQLNQFSGPALSKLFIAGELQNA